MATATLTIKDGIIISHSDRYFDSLSENGKEYWGNGWHVQIKDGRKDRPGRIICHAERMYSDGPAVCHREFRLADGTLGLAGGNIYSRYAYLRSEDFQNFLDKFGITAVKRQDPNQEYKIFTAYGTRGSAGGNLWTDGDAIRDWTDVEYGDPEKGESPSCYDGYLSINVSKASWAIVTVDEDWDCNHSYSRILYTKVRDVTTLREAFMSHPEVGIRAKKD